MSNGSARIMIIILFRRCLGIRQRLPPQCISSASEPNQTQPMATVLLEPVVPVLPLRSLAPQETAVCNVNQLALVQLVGRWWMNCHSAGYNNQHSCLQVQCAILRDSEEQTATSRDYISYYSIFPLSLPLLRCQWATVALCRQTWTPGDLLHLRLHLGWLLLGRPLVFSLFRNIAAR